MHVHQQEMCTVTQDWLCLLACQTISLYDRCGMDLEFDELLGVLEQFSCYDNLVVYKESECGDKIQ